MSFTFDSSENAYKIKQSSTSNTHGTATLNNLSLSKDVKILADFKLINTGTSSSTNNSQPALKFGNFFARIINAKSANVNRITLMNGAGTSDINYTNCSISNNVWYTLELVVESDIATVTLKQDDTTVATVTGNVSSYISTSNQFALAQGVNSTPYTFVRNIEVQEL